LQSLTDDKINRGAKIASQILAWRNEAVKN
jgi:hypothetical protein